MNVDIKRSFLLSFIIIVVAVHAQDTGMVERLKQIGLPLINIQTVNGESPACEFPQTPEGCLGLTIANAKKVPGRLTLTMGDSVLYDSGNYEEDISGMTIKIRGNYSAYNQKRPYKIKLQKKTDLFFRSDKKFKSKKWLLIRDDYYHATIGLKVNEMMGLQWTPACQYVNVILNGDYQGIYLLLESVERAENRLDVSDSGFLFEYDVFWWNENLYVRSPTPLPWPMHYTFKYPDSDDMTEQQLAYFIQMISQVEQSVFNGSYPSYIDVESFASWMLGHDILGSADGVGTNYFLTKYDNQDSKVKMGCLWDFDTIFENTDSWSTCHNMFFFKYLFSNSNDAFVSAYKRKWNQLMPTLYDELYNYLDIFTNSDEAAAIDESRILDNNRWGNSLGSLKGWIVYAMRQLEGRRYWLTTAIGELKTGIKQVEPDSQDEEAYFNLQGQRVEHPRNGIYVKNKKKVFFK